MTSDDLAWVPEACTLPTVEQPLRLAEFDDLFATALRGQQWLSPTSLRWRLDPAGDALHRDVQVPAAHVDVLNALAERAAAAMTA
jgi:hypothetical protein